MRVVLARFSSSVHVDGSSVSHLSVSQGSRLSLESLGGRHFLGAVTPRGARVLVPFENVSSLEVDGPLPSEPEPASERGVDSADVVEISKKRRDR